VIPIGPPKISNKLDIWQFVKVVQNLSFPQIVRVLSVFGH
jgi:hypothetical protein